MITYLTLCLENNELPKLLCYPKDIDEVEVEIEYRVYGRLRQATHYDPPEYPEIAVERVTAIRYIDGDGKHIILKDRKQSDRIDEYVAREFQEYIELACWEDWDNLQL